MQTNEPGPDTYTPPPPPPAGYPPPGAYPPHPGEYIHPTTPPKDPLVALVANMLIFPGYLYIGQWKKAIAAVFAMIFGFVAFIYVSTMTWFFGCAGAPLFLILPALTAVDAYRQTLQLLAGHTIGHWTFFNEPM